MRASRGHVRGGVAALTLAGAVATAAAPAWATPPGPCGGVPHIADVTLDGHHSNTDVISAWFAESGGRLQAVVRVANAVWEPAHDDSEAAGFAVLYTSGGQVRYVRAEAPRQAPVRFDHGVWTGGGGFVSHGPTVGETTAGPGGSVTIDIPEPAGAAPGTVLARPFVLTYDGVTAGEPHWVDRAPGGVTPAGIEFGADFVVGACGGAADPSVTTGVVLRAPARLVGGGMARITGWVAPARGGVPVTLTRTARRVTTHRVTTRADGTYSALLPVGEVTRVRAAAGGLGSQTRTIRVLSTVHVTLRRLRDGRVRVVGRTRPALPGRVLWLGQEAIAPSAVANAAAGRFSLTLRNPRRGRYEAVFIPFRGRAERSTSNTVVIR